MRKTYKSYLVHKHLLCRAISDDTSWSLNSPTVPRPAALQFDPQFGQPHTLLSGPATQPFKRLCTPSWIPAFMSGRTTPADETSPLLGHRRTVSAQTLVTDENTPKANSEETSKENLAWILAALWSAVFLGALDGTLPYRFVTTG